MDVPITAKGCVVAELSPEYLEMVSKTIADLYADATASMIRLVARRLANGIDGDGWAEQKLLEMLRLRADADAVVAQLQGVVSDAVTDAIEQAAAQGARTATTELALTAPLSTSTNTAAVQALARATISDLERTHLQILRQTVDVYRQSVEAGRVVTGTATRRQAAQRMLDNFAHRGVTGFVDSAGRQWSAESYAEMATRTSSGRAMIQGSIDQYEADDRNFVIVSDAPQECAACRDFEGKVLSIDGTGVGTTYGGFRVVDSVDGATSKGLFHQNCRHRISPVVPGLTRRMSHTADPEGDKLRQQQRYLERGVRRWKRVEAAALDDQARTKAKAKVREWQQRLRTHVDTNDLKRQRGRERIGTAI